MGKHNESVLLRLIKVLVGDGCWRWTGLYTEPLGYGRIKVDGRTVYPHRLIYEELVGPVPDGWDVGHKCHDEAAAAGLCDGGPECPHHACCNPSHLKAEPRGANLLASPLTWAYINANKTHCKRNHEFTPENTGWRKGKWRYCKACSRMTPEERRVWDAANV